MSQTVLVADDSQTIRKIVEMALKGSAYQVIGVGSAQDAMEASRYAPSVILLDYYMPDGSGYDVCRALKSNAATSDIPVIMLGGTYKQFDENMARQSGADGIVMKPFKTDTLVNAIEAVLAGSASAPPPQPSAFSAPAAAPAPPAYTPEPMRDLTPAPAPPPQRDLTPAPAPPPQRDLTPAPTPMRDLTPAPAPPQRDLTPAPAPMHTPPPFEQQPRPAFAQAPAPTPAPSAPAAGSQPRIATPDVNASTRQPVAPTQPAPAPTPTSGSGSLNVAMSRAEIEKMLREEVRTVVKQELPGMLRTVMGETFQTKVLPKLMQHTEERVERMVSERLEVAIRDNVRVELERLLSEE